MRPISEAYRYIVRSGGVRSRNAIVEGTRIAVHDVIGLLDHDVPDGLSYLLEHLGQDLTLLRKALPGDSSDEAVLQFAHEDDRTRAEERAALFRLLERAGETGLLNNVNFA